MTVQINFKVINSEFDQKYANSFNCGKESDSNQKYLDYTMYEIHNVISVELIKNCTYEVKGKSIDGLDVAFPIENVKMFRCHLDDGTHKDFAASQSILSSTQKTPSKKYNVTRCYFYINSKLPFKMLEPGLVVNDNEIPLSLK